MPVIYFWLCLVVLCQQTVSATAITKPDLSEYGVDISYPIHHYIDEKVSPYFKSRYDKLMDGCYKYYSKRECDATERARLEMSLSQPRSEHNYTKVGFQKTRVPKAAWDPLLQFFQKHKDEKHLEAWSRGYTYVNTWESPSYMVSLEDSSFREGIRVKELIWEHCKPIIEQWVGRKVVPTSLYGIRIYTDKSILATHVDRLPLVSSAIINVAQDVNEPWPAEIYDHDGKAYNVTMEPGDMVLYESHTVLHGRPFPMNGSFYANIFVHYKPIDHDENNRLDHLPPGTSPNEEGVRSLRTGTVTLPAMQDRYRKIGGHEQSNHEQDAIDKHLKQIDSENLSPSGSGLHANNVPAQQPKKYVYSEEDEPSKALRLAAQSGDLRSVDHILGTSTTGDNFKMVNSKDENGWQPLHEAAREGSLEVVKYLIEFGADIGGLTDDGKTPLAVARDYFGPLSAVVEYFVSIGAPE